ncbi:MAG: ATP-binding protein [Candidatus Woesearchaeota archaeon]
MKQILKTLIADFHTSKLQNFILRTGFTIPLNTTKIITLIGPRRAGKTTLLMQLIDTLITKHSVKKQHILYINFEDERLQLTTQDLQLIIDSYLELYPDTDLSSVYFFFDEIQEIQGWEQFIRRIYDTYSKHIYLTGSSAKLLSTEIATSLRGRSISYEVLPLSFKEYLNFKTIQTNDVHSTKNKAKIQREFTKYLTIGGFPELFELEEEISIKTLQTYLDVMIFRDLIERYHILNVEVLKLFIKKGISNVSKEFSTYKIFNELKSQGLKISKDTLYEFTIYLEDIYLLFFVPQYQFSLSKQLQSTKKIYCIDTGFIHSNSFSFSQDIGRVLENIVFLELRRQNLEIYYHKQQKECDFIIKKNLKISQAIQVTQTLKDENTKRREIEGLLEACKTHNLQQGVILTQDEEDEFKQEGITIQVLPIWKWLLLEQ